MKRAAMNKKKTPFTNKFGLNLRKKIVKWCICGISMYDAENWTLRKVVQKYPESFEMWCLKSIEKVVCVHRVRNEVRADLRMCGFQQPDKKKKRHKWFIIFKTRTKRELTVTWWNPAAQTRSVLDSSSSVPVPTLPHQLATILLLAFLLFELVAALLQCLCSESNKKNGEVGEYPQ